ncbi:fructose-6-phosphate aldolase [Megalodesulfovibrio gigas]|uniref:Probable transaldolase n=1 Tax=Megalodesulfovibrio gigas (strain ATCC 19364 / DSM 1382 / NCIMB 9332 / VKM B-1759) TaxID=1121448 RepID=T2GCX9_MEGG1|nr:fructose-6-phosphate aldolase [Megalodesulfovibrio gigas]AGW14029.1 putative translaldolase [Megalodesulfovibrio gigas DSM 1382 = ATCC 19364]
MEFFLDTASLDEIRKCKAYGLIDGVTTNPTLLRKEGQDWRRQMQAICKEVDGPVSLEVVGTTAKEMLAEARELIKFGPNVVIKIPMLLEGLIAVRELHAMDIPTNVTLVFSPMQALLAAKAGATYVSPFIGRLDALGQEGMECIRQIVTIYDNYDIATKVLVASIRHPMHVVESALTGADVATLPFAVIEQLARHPLTDKGLQTFLDDWKALAGDGAGQG